MKIFFKKNLTSRTILFRGDKDTCTNVLDSQLHIGGETNLDRVSDIQKCYLDTKNDGETQCIREVRVKVRLPL